MYIGTDIVKISRIEKALERFETKFTHRFLTKEEALRVKKPASLAGMWAAKESIAKALGCGIGASLSFHDIIIEKNSKGAPYFHLSTQAQQRYPIEKSSLSISHDGGFAIAVVTITLSTSS